LKHIHTGKGLPLEFISPTFGQNSNKLFIIKISLKFRNSRYIVQICFYHFENSILYIFFGGFGVFLTLKDFQTFKRFTKKKNAGLMNHIGRMVGALIASITAFLVAGLHIGTIVVWITPTLIGTAYIIYASKKYKKQKLQTE
jgi:hypothetical protein